MKLLNNILNIGWTPNLSIREERLLKFMNVVLIIVLGFIAITIVNFLAFGEQEDSYLLVVLGHQLIPILSHNV